MFYHENVGLGSIKADRIHIDGHFAKHVDDVGVDEHRVSTTGLVAAASWSDDVVHAEHVASTHHVGDAGSLCENLKSLFFLKLLKFSYFWRILVHLRWIDWHDSSVISSIENRLTSSTPRIGAEVGGIEAESVVVEDHVAQSRGLIRQPNRLVGGQLACVDVGSA